MGLCLEAACEPIAGANAWGKASGEPSAKHDSETLRSVPRSSDLVSRPASVGKNFKVKDED